MPGPARWAGRPEIAREEDLEAEIRALGRRDDSL